MHLNCVRGKWKLVELWEDYEHSSARFYVKNKLDGFVPVHYEELSLVDLSEGGMPGSFGYAQSYEKETPAGRKNIKID